MSTDYSLALSREHYDNEIENWRLKGFPDFRDEHTNLCDIGWSESDLAKILLAFEGSKIDDDFIFKMVRIIDACETTKTPDRDDVLDWLRKNRGKTYILVAE